MLAANAALYEELLGGLSLDGCPPRYGVPVILTAVSYTHLPNLIPDCPLQLLGDLSGKIGISLIHSNQDSGNLQLWICMLTNLLEIPDKFHAANSRVVPVSYTHLDVYKRQPGRFMPVSDFFSIRRVP